MWLVYSFFRQSEWDRLSGELSCGELYGELWSELCGELGVSCLVVSIVLKEVKGS